MCCLAYGLPIMSFPGDFSPRSASSPFKLPRLIAFSKSSATCLTFRIGFAVQSIRSPTAIKIGFADFTPPSPVVIDIQHISLYARPRGALESRRVRA